jgi:hypothetical protein
MSAVSSGLPPSTETIGSQLKSAFSQPVGQSIPDNFLKLLVELDRSQRAPGDTPKK